MIDTPPISENVINMRKPKGAKLINNLDTAVRMIKQIPDLKIWWDELHQKRFIKKANQDAREWCDNDAYDLTIYLQSECKFKRLSDVIVDKAVRFIGSENIRNEFKEYLEALKWDEVERIRNCFKDYLGAANNEYTLAASENTFISIAARTYLPGCQADHMPILEGAQGIGKTSAWGKLGGKFYGEVTASPLSKDFPISLIGKVIADIPELSSFRKAEVSEIKAKISCRADRLRMPWDRNAQDFPRRGIIVGTTNNETYLRDDTGGRRFWPINCGLIRLDLLEENRDQLFAEAVAAFKRGKQWHVMPQALTLSEQEARRATDPWEDRIATWLDAHPPLDGKVQNQTILSEALVIQIDRQTKENQMRAGAALKKLGWTPTQMGPAHKRVRAWEKSK